MPGQGRCLPCRAPQAPRGRPPRAQDAQSRLSQPVCAEIPRGDDARGNLVPLLPDAVAVILGQGGDEGALFQQEGVLAFPDLGPAGHILRGPRD